MREEEDGKVRKGFIGVDAHGELTEVNDGQSVNSVKLQSLDSKDLASINWVFGVNRSASVRPAKTLYSSSFLAGFVQI